MWYVDEGDFMGQTVFSVQTDGENIIALCATINAARRVAQALNEQANLETLLGTEDLQPG